MLQRPLTYVTLWAACAASSATFSSTATTEDKRLKKYITKMISDEYSSMDVVKKRYTRNFYDFLTFKKEVVKGLYLYQGNKEKSTEIGNLDLKSTFGNTIDNEANNKMFEYNSLLESAQKDQIREYVYECDLLPPLNSKLF